MFVLGLLVIKCLNFCFSKRVFISPSLLKDNFTGYSILSWHVFSLNTKYITLFLFTWFLIRILLLSLYLFLCNNNSYSFFCLLPRYSLCLGFLQLEYDTPSSNFLFICLFVVWYLAYFLFELLASVVWPFVINFAKLRHYYFCSLFLLFWHTNYALVICIVLGGFVLFIYLFFIFLSAFLLWEALIDYVQIY